VTSSWAEQNQRYLVASLRGVAEYLDRHAAGQGPAPPSQAVRTELERAASDLSAPSALDTLTDTFGLSAFERDLLVMVAGPELDAAFASTCAAAQGDDGHSQPTFGLALASLPDAHWSALAPSGPLRFWRLVELGAGSTIATSPLRIDERILHHLVGVELVDERLVSFVNSAPVPDWLPPSHMDAARRIAHIWLAMGNGDGAAAPQLVGPDQRGMRSVAATAAASVGLGLYEARVAEVPAAADDRALFVRLWERCAALGLRSLLLTYEDAAEGRRAGALADRIRGPVALSGPDPVQLRNRSSIHIDLGRPTRREQHQLWMASIPEMEGLEPAVDGVVNQFDLGTHQIRAGAADVTVGSDDADLPAVLWEAARAQSRPRGELLAQRIDPRATWRDLVVPDMQLEVLHEISAQVRHRATVYDTWSFSEIDSRGLGITALFVGRSGTGKTMAAEVLANELNLDLYRIDLSSVVSKYIGETESNLRRVFDAAESGGSILLFDEADALFGKRTEVKDSHDRYANIEVSYLLQRMEAYRGLAVLTTNMRDALDPAFLRRLRFVVEFPFPTKELRHRIWGRAFPAAAPTDALNPEQLSKLSVTGGNIRNVALNAAFLAADAKAPVGMGHLKKAARREFAKLERTISEAEIGGWA
jgi:hypothetical protein